jgi:tetraacyldisaccharide 4'-kinase
LILDDGFQHRRLHRDLDIVLVDATTPWGHGHLFPRGLLREPVAGLARADVIVLTRCDQVEPEALAGLHERIHRLAPAGLLVETRHRPDAWVNAEGRVEKTSEVFQTSEVSRNAAALCGIGNPLAFRRTLQGLGIKLHELRTYPDHHGYTAADVGDLDAWARRFPPNTSILTTQKDLVKMPVTRLGDRELWALRIRLEVLTGRHALDEKLSMVIGQSSMACANAI